MNHELSIIATRTDASIPFALRPLQRLLLQGFAASALTGLLVPGIGAIAHADPSQTAVAKRPSATKRPLLVDPPPPIAFSSVGAAGAAGDDSINGGTGGVGGTSGSANGVITGNYEFTGGSLSIVSETSNGGVGGTGVSRTGVFSSTSGSGGNGGQAGDVSFTFTSGDGVGDSHFKTSATAPAVLLATTGGQGGVPGTLGTENGNPGRPGDGGAAGNVTFNMTDNLLNTIESDNKWSNGTPGTAAVSLTSTGGNGGAPSSGAQSVGSVDGPTGGNGGNGGTVTFTTQGGSITSQGSALVAVSQGGNGNAGTQGAGGFGKGAGGKGGTGGTGGPVQLTLSDSTAGIAFSAVGAPTAATGTTVTIDSSGSTAQASYVAASILAQSLGGLGGDGGSGTGAEGKSGAGGDAGSAGKVTLTSGSLSVNTSGFSAAGIVLQSVGGSGGNGPPAGGAFSSKSGSGGLGGTSGIVRATILDTQGNGFLATQGDDSTGLVAQSIGGGGGYGGSVQGGSAFAGVAVGGNGEKGGDAGAVTIANGDGTSSLNGIVVDTHGDHSSALVAQSIGGGGGLGGAAAYTVIGVTSLAYTVGGAGGSGGTAGIAGTTQVQLDNYGVLSTVGNHSAGVIAQAVGGGGGDGGAAFSLTGSNQLNVNVTVGGSGGGGGDSGDVIATNHQQILTGGADAWGLLAQSIGGGGGNGGSSTATSYQIVNPENPIPQISIVVSVGGTGGSGGVSGNIAATNNGLIITSGAGAHGLVAQSIGGGGGNGGDSSALNESIGKSGDAIDVTVDVGGHGGGGGTSGDVLATNAANALIWTIGDSARGIFAQSVSGGGGTGGTSKSESDFLSKASSGVSKYTLTLGGTGGGGADAAQVIVENDGNVLTLGNTADGIFAQSIGGGGGLGGHASSEGASGSSGKSVTVGGASGTAANGGMVTVTNNGNVVTRGGNSAGIYAQSVGGGGGKAGTPTKGGDSAALMSVQDYLFRALDPANGSVLSNLVTTLANGTVGLVNGSWATFNGTSQLDALAGDYHGANATVPKAPSNEPDNQSSTVNLTLGGGNYEWKPAPTGNGGAVTVTNPGQIETNGPLSAGIWAQSIGGGGGDAGTTDVAATTSGANNSYGGVSSLGGQGLNVGNGGTVTVNHQGVITTAGDASYGILAQSIGAGGGHSGTTDSVNGSTTGSLTISIGGQGNVQGDGGTVNVQAVNNGNSIISTHGNDAIGVLAQSIGGGGGATVVMHTKASADNETVGSTDPTRGNIVLQLESDKAGKADPDHPPSDFPTCPNSTFISSSCGNGATVTVNVDTVATAGRNAHGILAQTFGGSGGVLLGASLSGADPYTPYATAYGNGGNIAVTVNKSVSTSGDGAYGILAQSIGGGGILAGDLATSGSAIALPPQDKPYATDQYRVGIGGIIDVTVAAHAQITTTGANAHGIFAQDIGGGGGLISTTAGLMMGGLGGSGSAHNIDITNNGIVQVFGQGSSAIYTNSEGANHTSLVNVSNYGTIAGTTSAPAIVLSGNGNTNGNGSVHNYSGGTIQATGGVAIQAAGTGAFALVIQDPGSQIFGDLNIGTVGQLNNGGTWNTGDASTVGTVNNLAGGRINIGGANLKANKSSILNGNLVSAGTIATSVDFASGTASTLQVNGNATISGGTLLITPTSLKPVATSIVTASGSLAVGNASTLVAANAANTSVTYSITRTANALSVIPVTQFAKDAAAKGYSASQQSLGAHLDAGFTSEISDNMSKNYAKLANLDEASYHKALSSLSNEGVQAIGTARLAASHAFVDRMNSCPQFDRIGQEIGEHDCVWTRAAGNQVDRDGTGNSVGYREDNAVFQMGGQKGIGDGWFLGASIAYDHSKLTADTSSVSGHGWTAGAVLKRQVDEWLFSAGIDAGSGQYDSSRQVTLGAVDETATASFSAQHVGLHGRVARQFALSESYIKPYVDVHATYLRSGAYSETGAGDLDLNVSSSHDTILAISPMLEVGRRFDLRDGLSLDAFVSAGAALYSNNAWGANASLVGSVQQAGTFNTTSTLPNQRVKLNAGMDLVTTKSLDVRVEYTGEFASGYASNSGAVKASYTF